MLQERRARAHELEAEVAIGESRNGVNAKPVTSRVGRPDLLPNPGGTGNEEGRLAGLPSGTPWFSGPAWAQLTGNPAPSCAEDFEQR